MITTRLTTFLPSFLLFISPILSASISTDQIVKRDKQITFTIYNKCDKSVQPMFHPSRLSTRSSFWLSRPTTQTETLSLSYQLNDEPREQEFSRRKKRRRDPLNAYSHDRFNDDPELIRYHFHYWVVGADLDLWRQPRSVVCWTRYRWIWSRLDQRGRPYVYWGECAEGNQREVYWVHGEFRDATHA